MTTGPYAPDAPGIPPQPYPSPHAPMPYGVNTARGNPLGIVSFIAGMLLVLWPFVAVALQAAMVGAGDFTAFEVFGWVDGAVGIALGLVALAAGMVAVALRGRPKVLGGIGMGIGILSIASTIAYAVIYPIVTSFP